MWKLTSKTFLGLMALIPQNAALQLAQGVQFLLQLLQRGLDLGVGEIRQRLRLGQEVAQADKLDRLLGRRPCFTQLNELRKSAGLERGQQFQVLVKGNQRRARLPVRGGKSRQVERLSGTAKERPERGFGFGWLKRTVVDMLPDSLYGLLEFCKPQPVAFREAVAICGVDSGGSQRQLVEAADDLRVRQNSGEGFRLRYFQAGRSRHQRSLVPQNGARALDRFDVRVGKEGANALGLFALCPQASAFPGQHPNTIVRLAGENGLKAFHPFRKGLNQGETVRFGLGQCWKGLLPFQSR